MPSNFLVKKDDLNSTQVEAASSQTPAKGEALMRIDRFALTANNITYGVAGDLIGYWKFFPASGDWGRIPVWGMGTVIQSEHPDLAVGTQCYGYFPMSSELLVQPEKISARGFADAANHRAELPIVYNQYSIVSEANGFESRYQNHSMVYRPLFTTSFVLDDYFADNDFFGASTMILGSASSKTAFGLAFMLKQRSGINVVGLTSKTNKAFVTGLGLYDQVLTYDEVSGLAQQPSAYVDMAGNPDVLAQVHQHLQDNLLNSCGVGITHWETRSTDGPVELPGAKPTMFFAPTQIVKRNSELGPAEYQSKIAAATQAFLGQVDNWVSIQERPFKEVEAVYRTVLNGAPPNESYVVTL